MIPVRCTLSIRSRLQSSRAYKVLASTKLSRPLGTYSCVTQAVHCWCATHERPVCSGVGHRPPPCTTGRACLATCRCHVLTRAPCDCPQAFHARNANVKSAPGYPPLPACAERLSAGHPRMSSHPAHAVFALGHLLPPACVRRSSPSRVSCQLKQKRFAPTRF